MLTSVKGTYRDGQVVLRESPAQVQNETPVIVTFIGSSETDLRSQDIDQDQAGKLRSSLMSFEDWDEPEMDIYNDYESAKANL